MNMTRVWSVGIIVIFFFYYSLTSFLARDAFCRIDAGSGSGETDRHEVNGEWLRAGQTKW